MEKATQGEIRKTARKMVTIKQKHPQKYDEIKVYGERFLKTMHTLRIYLAAQGQFPFPVKTFAKRPTAFIGKYFEPMSILYAVGLLFSSFSLLSVTFGYFTFFFPSIFNFQPTVRIVTQENINDLGKFVTVPKDWEKNKIQESFTPLLVFYLMGFYLTVMNLTVVLRRQIFLDYLNYWLFSLQIMEIDIPKSVHRKMKIEIFLSVGFIGALLILSYAGVVKSIGGMIDVLSTLMLRPFRYQYQFKIPDEVIHERRDTIMFYVYKIPGTICMMQFYIGGRAAIIHFVFYMRLLAVVSKTWNQRLRDGLTKNVEEADNKVKEPQAKKWQSKAMSGDGDAEEFGMYQEPVVAELEPEQVVRPKIRIGLKELLEDHFNIVQLYKMTEDIFGWQLIIYYFIQNLMMIFQCYHMVTVYSAEQVADERYGAPGTEVKTLGTLVLRLNSTYENDLYTLATREFLTVIFTISVAAIYLFITLDTAHEAYVEGMAGFQILRRNCYLGSCDTTKERNFVHTLVVSFAPNNPIQISADGYFDINRTLVPQIMVNVVGYLVACYTLKIDSTSQFWNYGRYANLCRPTRTPGIACP